MSGQHSWILKVCSAHIPYVIPPWTVAYVFVLKSYTRDNSPLNRKSIGRMEVIDVQPHPNSLAIYPAASKRKESDTFFYDCEP